LRARRSILLLVSILALLLLAGSNAVAASSNGQNSSSKKFTRVKDLAKKVKRSTQSGFRRLKGNVQRHLHSHDDGELDDGELKRLLRRLRIGHDHGSGNRRSEAPGWSEFPVPSYEGGWQWPLEEGVVSSSYGRRDGRPHRGLDIAADLGVPVLAAADGEVIYSGSEMSGYGNVVIVRHDRQTTTLYAHNQRNLVAVGSRVSVGDPIARLGSTGRSTGPHVHFEIRIEERAVDPLGLLPAAR
jgi:murein DD-endopeptidase MepM/ murein hydrolase activator NlpD